MPWDSRIPRITAQASLRAQRAVEQAGQEVEFRALQIASRRRRTGDEMNAIRWVPSRRYPHSGRVVAGYVTRFHEYGTVHMPAHPTMGPAAEETAHSFFGEMAMIYR